MRHELAPRWLGKWFDAEVLATLAALLRARASGWGLYDLLSDPTSEGMILAVLSRDNALRLRAAGVPVVAL